MTTRAAKRYISADELLQASYALGAMVIESGFRPDFVIGVWRGGTPVGIAIHELLDRCGIKADHTVIRTTSYRAMGERRDAVQVYGLEYVTARCQGEDTMLLVDDIYDTGLSIEAALAELRRIARANTPHDIRIAAPWYNPPNNRSGRAPDYYIHTTDQWLVFPHELDGLGMEEIKRNKPISGELIQRLGKYGLE